MLQHIKLLWLRFKLWNLNMKRNATKDVVYGGLLEILKNDRHYRLSSVGREYSGLTELGKETIVEYLGDMSWRMIQAEREELNARAKEMVFEELKKKHE